MVMQIGRSQKCGPGLKKMLDAFPDAIQKSNGWWAHLDNPTFDFFEQENGAITIHSWTGRTVEEILARGGLKPSDIRSASSEYQNYQIRAPLDLLTLAQAKRIHWRFLEELEIGDGYNYHGRPCVKIPYHLPDGTQHTKIKVRKALNGRGREKQVWDEGTPGEIIPYGLHKLAIARQAGYLLIGEGESDAWACWLHNLPYLGVPGAQHEKCLCSVDLNDIPRVYILQEPDQYKKMLAHGQGFYKNVHRELRADGYKGEIFCVPFEQLTGSKDPAELHIQLWTEERARSFHQLIQQALKQAIPANDAEEQGVKARIDIDMAITRHDAKTLYGLGSSFAQLPRHEYVALKSDIKKALGKDINLNDLDRVVNAARKEGTTEDYPLYEKRPGAMILFPLGGGTPLEMSNFTAEIIADILTDDGAESTRSYALEAKMNGRPFFFEVPAKEFSKCEWVDEHMGARARITTGQSMKSHLVNAIKYCSDPVEQVQYAHTGWRTVDGQMVYLYAGGCLGQVGQGISLGKKDLTSVSTSAQSTCEANVQRTHVQSGQVGQVGQVPRGVSVKLTGPLAKYTFSEEGSTDIQQAIRASLGFLDLCHDDTVTVPLYMALWRSVLGDIDFGVHLAGQTGWGKSELAALIQQHFGAAMSAKKLPGSWESTDNSLEMLLFQAKDTIVVVDDFKPKGGKVDQDRLHMKADRLFRQIGNGASRGRLNSNLEQRAERRPRCLLLSTGEDVPRGQSVKARGIVLTMTEQITKGSAARALSQAQRHAEIGLYAQAMRGYIVWLAPRIETLQAQLSVGIAHERDRLRIDGHARAGTNIASLIVGMKSFLQYAISACALTEQEAHAYQERCITALLQLADDASREDKEERPSEQWRRLLSAAITNKSAHLVTSEGNNPGVEYGWIKRVRYVERDSEMCEEETFSGGGTQIGWIDGEDIYLLPTASYKVVKEMGSATGNDVTTLETTLRKFLVQDKMLASTDQSTPRKTITVRRSLERLRRDVLHIKKGVLFPDETLLDSLDQLDQTPPPSAQETPSTPSQAVDQKRNWSSESLDHQMTNDHTRAADDVPKRAERTCETSELPANDADIEEFTV